MVSPSCVFAVPKSNEKQELVFRADFYSHMLTGTESVLYPTADVEGLGIAALNTAATAIVIGLREKLTKKDLVDCYAELFKLPALTAHKDVDSCVKTLLDIKAVTYV